MTTTITRPPQATERTEQTLSFVCVNPEHRLIGMRRDAMRLRDGRGLAPIGRVPEHDYCTTDDLGCVELRFGGRPASCPAGALADDHEWVETTALRR